jgi:DUF1016 N-terminal domain
MTDQLQPQFTEVLALIKNTQNYVIATSNQELIKLYWSIGKYIDDRLQTTEWGKKTIQQLADFIQTKEPGIKGFEKRNLERMRQFYKTYPEIATAVRSQLSWTHHRIIMSRFDILLCLKARGFLLLVLRSPLATSDYSSIVEAIFSPVFRPLQARSLVPLGTVYAKFEVC